jgi:hypothetical protein
VLATNDTGFILAPSAPVTSVGRSVDGIEALKGPQHPPERTPGRE